MDSNDPNDLENITLHWKDVEKIRYKRTARMRCPMSQWHVADKRRIEICCVPLKYLESAEQMKQ